MYRCGVFLGLKRVETIRSESDTLPCQYRTARVGAGNTGMASYGRLSAITGIRRTTRRIIRTSVQPTVSRGVITVIRSQSVGRGIGRGLARVGGQGNDPGGGNGKTEHAQHSCEHGTSEEIQQCAEC